MGPTFMCTRVFIACLSSLPLEDSSLWENSYGRRVGWEGETIEMTFFWFLFKKRVGRCSFKTKQQKKAALRFIRVTLFFLYESNKNTIF